MYLGNGEYEIQLSSGRTVTMSKDDFNEFVSTFAKKAFDDQPHTLIGNHVETTPYNDVFTGPKMTILTTEIKDSAYEDLEWTADLSTVIEETIDASLEEARTYYENNYIMIAR